MSTTQTLAALIGLYFVAGGIGLLIDRNNASALMKDLTSQPAFGFLAGIIAFAIGAAVVGIHNNWNSLLSGFVSLVGWISLLEGVLILACRNRFLSLVSRLFLSASLVSAFGIGTMVLGVILLGAAFAN